MNAASLPKVDILLATYNGAIYLPEQLESLLNQTYQNWQLIVRDDGSKDDTLNIIKRFATQHPEKVRIIQDNKGGLGATQNFGELLFHSTSDYLMFCDQDDVWLPQKIEHGLECMLLKEKYYGATMPILVHTDLQVVDETLTVIAPSAWKDALVPIEDRQVWNRLLLANTVTGCTMLLNKALKDAVMPIDKSAIIHDWWIALIASLIGVVEPLREGTILYRQHQHNALGLSKRRTTLLTLLDPDYVSSSKQQLIKTQKQAEGIAKHLNVRLEPNVLKLLETFSHLDSLNFLQRRHFLLKHSFLKFGTLANLVLMICA
jgi:glycosyltransferase involved in cell wall biosynthesis